MTAINISPWVFGRLRPAGNCRNGMIPNPIYAGQLAREMNQISRWRGKELFCGAGGELAAIPTNNTAGSRTRWRFAQHTSPLVQYVGVTFWVAQTSSWKAGDPEPLGQLELFNASGTSLGTAQVHFGATPLANVDVPSNFGQATLYIDASAFQDTDIRGTFTDVNLARLVAATVFEVCEAPDTANGYIAQQFALGQDILDVDRSNVEVAAALAWKRQGPSVLHFSSDLDTSAPGTLSATAHNLFDASFTAPSASSPGYQLDMRYKTTVRRSANGVPCVLAVCALSTPASAGTVSLRSSSNTVIASIAGGWTTSASWQTVAFNLPATEDKYDLFLVSDGVNQLNVLAASVYEYEA